MADGEKIYIVRGAKMRCSNGTHPRQINLPTSHGSYVKGKPVMNKGDNVVDKNISYFGICKKCTQGEDIYLLDEKGVQLPPGKKCLVQIIDEWQNVKDDTLVEGKPALINDSYLICSLYEGKITFETDGQEEK